MRERGPDSVEGNYMPMVPFHTLFGDLAFKETRSATVRGRGDVPDGEYGFLELYCDEVDCDCRRVLIDVISSTGGSTTWATINYGWESPEFYARWSKIKGDAADLARASLDPLNIQTEHSPGLLRLFEFVLKDEAYVERLKRHYALFKGALHEKERARKARRSNKRTGRKRTK
jgi:hypothetical protein